MFLLWTHLDTGLGSPLHIQTHCFAECAKAFHKGGARVILCGKSWEKLESLSEQLSDDCDPTLVSSNYYCLSYLCHSLYVQSHDFLSPDVFFFNMERKWLKWLNDNLQLSNCYILLKSLICSHINE